MITTLKSGAILLASTVLLTACGSGSSSNSGPADPVTDDGGSTNNSTGVFSDSPVAGIAYLTDPSAQEGTTNAAGEYEYQEGDTVQFSVGNIEFPPVSAKGKVTPLDMGGDGADLSTPSVINILRFLQTLDDDGDPENGITVSEETATALSDAVLPFELDSFESEATTVIKNALGRDLVSESDAIAHFEGSLKGDLLGSWVYEEENGIFNVLTFFGDDRYVIAHSDADDGDQAAGSAEYGSYTWDPVSGDFSVTLIRESDGSGGLYNASEPNATQGVTLTVADGVLTLTLDDGSAEFAAIQSEEDDMVGAWFLPEADGEGDGEGGVLLTFDGTDYVLVHTWNTEAYVGDELLRVTSEWNTYEWGADGSFSVDIPSVETDGPGGLFNKEGNEDEDSPKMVVGNGGLDYQINPDETIAFAPVASFEAALKDLEGDTSSAPVKRAYGRFFGGADASFVLGKIGDGEEGSYGMVSEEGTDALTLNSDGTGSIAFGEFDVNDVTWKVSTSGVLHFTETDGSGDQWFWVMTPIKSKSRIAALIEITTPESQEDSADLSFIADVQGVGFEEGDFSGLVYNIFEDTGVAYISTLNFDPTTGTIEAFDDEANVELTGAYSLEAGRKVLQIDFVGKQTHFVVYQGYDTTLGAYEACWIDDESVTTVSAAFEFADANPCSDYLTKDFDTAETIQANWN